MDDWLLGKLLAGGLQEFGLSNHDAWQAVARVKVLVKHQDWFAASKKETKAASDIAGTRPYRVLSRLLNDPDVQRLLGVNRFQDVLWYGKEAFDALLRALFAVAVPQVTGAAKPGKRKSAKRIARRYRVIERLQKAHDQAGYQVERLLALANGEPLPEESPEEGSS